MNKIITALAILLLALTSTACHASKQVPDSTATANVGTLPGVSASNAETTWQSVTLPVKVRLASPKSISLSGRCTMVNDSLVHISMRFLGMELAVVRLTADSLWVVDKYHRYAFAESTKAILGSHRLSMADIQGILFGIDRNGDPVIYNNPAHNRPVTVTYADFVPTPAGQAASAVNVNATIHSGVVDASLLWNFGQADWNTTRIPDFTPPRGYTMLGIQDILDILGNI